MSDPGSVGNTQGFPAINVPIADMSASGKITSPWYYMFRTLWARSGAANGGATNPTGVTAPWLTATPPGGWLICDGIAISRDIYAALYSVIGTDWGNGDGSTTFNLPDFRNRFLIGAGTYVLTSRGGTSSLTLTVGQLPSHSHTITDPGHHHTALVASSTNTAGGAAGTGVSGNTGNATTGITINDTGSGDPVNFTPPYAAINYIIKT